jgi:flagellar biogenesis protein FliO
VSAQISYVGAVMALGAVLGLLFAGAALTCWLRVRFLGASPHLRLAVLEQRPLDTRHRIVLIRCDTTEHLLAVGPAGIEVLSRMPAPPAPTGDPA